MRERKEKVRRGKKSGRAERATCVSSGRNITLSSDLGILALRGQEKCYPIKTNSQITDIEINQTWA